MTSHVMPKLFCQNHTNTHLMNEFHLCVIDLSHNFRLWTELNFMQISKASVKVHRSDLLQRLILLQHCLFRVFREYIAHKKDGKFFSYFASFSPRYNLIVTKFYLKRRKKYQHHAFFMN